MISFRQPIGIPGKSQYVPTWGQAVLWALGWVAVVYFGLR
jgi:hypothetical protein